MLYRRFGTTDLQTSALGFGTWALGGQNNVGGVPIGWRPIPEQQAAATIQAALDAGITFFDTSDFYGRGHSEELLGKYLPRSRSDLIIATKVGLMPQMQPENPKELMRCYTPEHITASVEGSLRRLRRETIDLYQLHGPDSDTLESEATWRALEQLKQAGKIRHVGVSTSSFSRRFTLDDFGTVLHNPLVDAVQVRYNLAHLEMQETLAQVRGHRAAIIARVPFEHGLLLGKYRDAASFSAEDHRRQRISEAWAGQVQRFQHELRAALPARTESPVELPLLWLLGDPDVTLVLCGATSPEQIALNAAALERPPLSADERAATEQIARGVFA